jgi:hypothetical protein
MIISPPLETPGEDFLDDLAALYQWLKAHVGRFGAWLTPFEKAFGSTLLRPIVDWLNPRKNRWYGIALIGICIGLFLATGEGGQLGRYVVFANIECLALLMGYAFFVKPLWLARPAC